MTITAVAHSHATGLGEVVIVKRGRVTVSLNTSLGGGRREEWGEEGKGKRPTKSNLVTDPNFVTYLMDHPIYLIRRHSHSDCTCSNVQHLTP